MKKILILITLLLLVSSSAFAATIFPDLKGDEWYGKNAIALADKGLITGFPDGTFRPTSNITVAQFISVAVRTIDPKVETSQGKWYTPYLEKAIKFGIVSSGEFNNMNAPITRGQMAKILVKTLEYQGESISDTSKFTSQIGDYASIDKSLQPYILKAYAFGLMGGYPDGTFKPERLATRADSSVMLNRVFDKTVRSVPVMKNPYLSDRGVPIINGKEVVTTNGEKIINYGYEEHVKKYVAIRDMLASDYPEQQLGLMGSDKWMAIYLLDDGVKDLTKSDVDIFLDYNGSSLKYAMNINDYSDKNKEIVYKTLKIMFENDYDFFYNAFLSKNDIEDVRGDYNYVAIYSEKYNANSIIIVK